MSDKTYIPTQFRAWVDANDSAFYEVEGDVLMKESEAYRCWEAKDLAVNLLGKVVHVGIRDSDAGGPEWELIDGTNVVMAKFYARLTM